MNFTIEVENEVDDGKRGMPFCDTRLTCDYTKAKIISEVYRKASSTNLNLNFRSNGPSFQKDGIFGGLLHRNDIVSQTPEAQAEEKEFLANVFIYNGMEPERVDKVIWSWIPKAERSQPKKDDHRAEAQ